MITFSQVFQPMLGLGSALLILLVAVRIIEAIFYYVGFNLGKQKVYEEEVARLKAQQDFAIKEQIAKQVDKVNVPTS